MIDSAATERNPRLVVGYQGEPGSYSEQAVEALFPGADSRARRDLRSIFADVASGGLDFGVVPIENSFAGAINETYDLLSEGGVTIVGEVIVKVEHALLALPGTRIEDLHKVKSHPQALAQCEPFLRSLGVDLVAVYDTAGAAKSIVEEGLRDEAAVASLRAAELYNLIPLATSIQANRFNRTRFVAIGTGSGPQSPADKTSLVFEVDNTPGSLYRCLRPIAEMGLNLSKLESRPARDQPWQYRFYLDVDCGIEDRSLARALDALRAESTDMRVLGSYKRWEAPD